MHKAGTVSPQQQLHKCDRAGRGCDGEQSQAATGEREPQRNQLIAHIRPIVLKSPDPIECDFERQEDTRRGHQQNDQRDELDAMPRVHHRLKIADHKFLTRGKVVAE